MVDQPVAATPARHFTVQALADFFAGNPVRGRVDLARFELLA